MSFQLVGEGFALDGKGEVFRAGEEVDAAAGQATVGIGGGDSGDVDEAQEGVLGVFLPRGDTCAFGGGFLGHGVV